MDFGIPDGIRSAGPHCVYTQLRQPSKGGLTEYGPGETPLSIELHGSNEMPWRVAFRKGLDRVKLMNRVVRTKLS